MTDGADSIDTMAPHEMRYSKLPEIFEDSKQVESDWYTLAVKPPPHFKSHGLRCTGCDAIGI